MSSSVPSNTAEHPYVSYCRKYLEDARQDPLYNAPHLKEFRDYLSESSSQWHIGSYTKDAPFLWSYTCPDTGDLQLSPKHDLASFKRPKGVARVCRDPQVLFLSGYPSPDWLNVIGDEYKVDMHFFQQHFGSIRPSVNIDVYAEPSLPSRSRDILKLSIPTIGYLGDVGNLFGDISRTRSLLVESLREQGLKNARYHPVGQAIIRSVYLHDSERFTLMQEISMCLLREQDVWTVLVWTDASGEDKDPDLSFPFKEASQRPDLDPKFCPTVFDRFKKHEKRKTSHNTPSQSRFHATQVFNSLHKVYGKTLESKSTRLQPFYAVSEVYSFAAAAENQFLNMMGKILEQRIEGIVREGLQKHPSTSDTLTERMNLQYDRTILDGHSDRIINIIAFLNAADDPVWFRLSDNDASQEVKTARMNLLRDFQHLNTQVSQLIQRCERAMDMVAHNASLLEAKRSNLQSEGLEKLTRLTTFVTLLYVPLSFVCAFFGMNFSTFGQGEMSLWVWAAVSAPILLISLFFLKRRLSKE